MSRAVIAAQHHRFVQTVRLATVTEASGTSPVYAAYSVTAGVISQFAQFAAIFDQYRMVKLVYHFQPMVNITGSGVMNRLARVVTDYDDAVPLLSESDYMSYERQIAFPSIGGTPAAVEVQPHVIIDYSYVNESIVAPWIDCINTSVPHYGVKAYFPYTGLPEAYAKCEVFCDIYIEFKNVH